jgi:hypothetical protein
MPQGELKLPCLENPLLKVSVRFEQKGRKRLEKGKNT